MVGASLGALAIAWVDVRAPPSQWVRCETREARQNRRVQFLSRSKIGILTIPVVSLREMDGISDDSLA
jgi:hypothetical protein